MGNNDDHSGKVSGGFRIDPPDPAGVRHSRVLCGGLRGAGGFSERVGPCVFDFQWVRIVGKYSGMVTCESENSLTNPIAEE